MTNPALSLIKIDKTFGTHQVLRNVSLEASPGEFIAIVGPSGCGKSTLLRVIAGLEGCDCGVVKLGDIDVSALGAADRDMAMVFQSYALYPHLTARQNIALPLTMRRLTALERLPLLHRFSPSAGAKMATIRRDVERVAETLRIADLLDRKPSQMSGGQRQRVALGRAVVRRPKAFLMDEPLSNLDAALRVHTREEIVALHRDAGVVTLYVTHDQEEALGMADRVAVMMGGRILQVTKPETIYADPDHIDVATFIGSPKINLLPGRIHGDGALSYAGLVLSQSYPAKDRAVTLGVRPEHFHLSGQGGAGAIALRRDRTAFLGAEVILHLRTQADGSPVLVRMSPKRLAELGSAEVLHASVHHRDVLVFAPDGSRMRPVERRHPQEAHHEA